MVKRFFFDAMSFSFPDFFRFADSHEYAFVDHDLVRIGISAFAVDQLGDIVFVDLPDEGTSINKGESFGSVESVKAVEDMYAPVSGEIVRINNSVMASPEELQNDPHGEGWLLIIRPENLDQLQDLMDSETYSKKISA
tara:strand:+ start:2470 stop:2883 length:414 start_codon:yes stop_codon:yes gene_type:complete